MERPSRRDDRRPHRDDNRNHRPKYGKRERQRFKAADTDSRKEQDRSRSPRNDRRDDRRRERSPQRGPPSRGGPPGRDNRGRDHQRDRDSNRGGPPPRRPGDRTEAKPNGAGSKTQQSGKGRQETDTKMQDVPEDEDSEAEMNRIMGFKDFRTTKNTKVPGNDKNFAIYKVKKAEYRQYMNRTGGFNRPLSPSRV